MSYKSSVCLLYYRHFVYTVHGLCFCVTLLIKTSHKVFKAAVRVKTFLLRHPVSLGFILDIKLTHHENYHTSIAASFSPLSCAVFTLSMKEPQRHKSLSCMSLLFLFLCFETRLNASVFDNYPIVF